MSTNNEPVEPKVYCECGDHFVEQKDMWEDWFADCQECASADDFHLARVKRNGDEYEVEECLECAKTFIIDDTGEFGCTRKGFFCHDCWEDECDKYEDEEDEDEEDEDEDKTVKDKFLAKYLVPNFFTKEQLNMEHYDDAKWEGFKEFVKDWAMSGELNEILEELRQSYESSDDE